MKSSHRLSVLVMVAVAATLVPTVHGQVTAVGGEVQLGGVGIREVNPSVMVSSPGLALVVWERLSVNGSSVVGRWFDAGGNPSGAEIELCSPGTGFCQNPAVAINLSSTRIVVVWEGDDGDGGGVFASFLGSDWSAPVQVNEEPAGLQGSPAVAVDEQNGFVVVWTCYERGMIMARHFAEDGTAIGSELQVSQSDGMFVSNPRIAMNENDEYVIAWSTYGQDGFGEGVATRLFDSADDPVGDALQPYENGAGHQSSPGVGIDRGRSFLVSWSQRSIMSQWFDSTGTRLNAPLEISAPDGALIDPALAMTSGGGYVIAWSELPAQDLFLSAYSKDGVLVADSVAINTSDAARGRDLQVAINNTGELVVAWEGSSTGGGIWARRFQVGFPGTITMCRTDYQINERSSYVQVTVCRGGDTSSAASVQYQTADGDALDGFDYQGTSGSLSWSANDKAERSFTVSILGDAAAEEDESFSVFLHSPTGASLGESHEAEIRIADNDVSTVQLESDEIYSFESAGSAEVKVVRSGPSSYPLQVEWVLEDGTATYPEDYTITSGTCSWAAGNSDDYIISIPFGTGPQVTEDHEVFRLSLTHADPAALFADPSSAEVTIIEDYPSVVVHSTTSQTVNEDCGSATVSIERKGSSVGEISVLVSTSDQGSDGSATEGTDYSASSETLVWNDGDSSPKVVSIPIIDDTRIESTEEFSVYLSQIPGGVSVGPQKELTIVISDDDQEKWDEKVTHQFWFQENAGYTSVIINRGELDGESADGRQGDPSNTFSIRYNTIAGSAILFGDFKGLSGIRYWLPGEAESQEIPIHIYEDEELEGDESYYVRFYEYSSNTLLALYKIFIIGNDWIEQRTNTSTQDHQQNASVATDQAGNSLIVWESTQD